MEPISESIRVPSSTSELRRLHAFVAEFWVRNQLPPEDAPRVELGLEEIFVNSVTHGRAGTDGLPVTVAIRLDGDRLELMVEDHGPPFDPLTQPRPDTSVHLDGRPEGGLGIHLVRTMLDDVRYERVDGHNRLTMTARLGGAGLH